MRPFHVLFFELVLPSFLLALMKGTLAVLLLVAVVCVGHVLAADRQLAFALEQRNLGHVEKLFWERSDPNHADYGKYALFTKP